MCVCVCMRVGDFPDMPSAFLADMYNKIKDNEIKMSDGRICVWICVWVFVSIFVWISFSLFPALPSLSNFFSSFLSPFSLLHTLSLPLALSLFLSLSIPLSLSLSPSPSTSSSQGQLCRRSQTRMATSAQPP